MPEGDTIHRAAAMLRAALVGAVPRRVDLRAYPRVRLSAPVTAVEAIGKHCIITFGESDCLRVHLGMHGAWRRFPLPWTRRGEVHIVIETASEVLVCFQAKEVELFLAADRKRHPVLKRLGPDLCAPDDPDWEVVLARARATEAHRPVADLLGDQGVACGFGNVYRNELPFLGVPTGTRFYQLGLGFAPALPASLLSDEQLLGVYRRGRDALLANLGDWPRTTVCDARRTSLDRGSTRMWVYGRSGLPCFGCGTAILSRAQGEQARATQWCPHCQPVDGLGGARVSRLRLLARPAPGRR